VDICDVTREHRAPVNGAAPPSRTSVRDYDARTPTP
jgi:hypothetical protein